MRKWIISDSQAAWPQSVVYVHILQLAVRMHQRLPRVLWIERITKLFLANLERVAKYFLFAQLTVRIDGAPAASGGGVPRELHPELPRFISFAPLRACPLACFSAHPKKLLFSKCR